MILAIYTMNKKYNLIKIILVFGLVLSFTLPNFTLAESQKGPKQNQGNAQKNNSGLAFCNRISKMEEIQTRMIEKAEEMKTKREERNQKRMDNRQTREERHIANRLKWDANRSEHFAKLEELANTDEKKLAVLEFRQTMEQAISERRADFDMATSDFQNAIAQEIENRRELLDMTAEEFRNKTQLAIEKAKEACLGEEPDVKNIMNTFKEEMRIAKEEFKAANDSIRGLKDKVQEFSSIRKQSLEQAKEEFKGTLELAKEKLLSVLKTVDEDEDEEGEGEEEGEEQ